MKYRMLTTDELDGFREEFVIFLSANGIDNTKWIFLKSDHKEKAYGILEAFSDFIFESILNKIKYLEFFDGQNLLAFQCGDIKIHLIGLESKQRYDTIDQMLASMHQTPEDFRLFQQEKEYHPDRNTELFRMAESGAKICDQGMYDYLIQFINK